MEKIKVHGAYLNLEQTAKLFGMSPEEIESVRRVTDEVRVAQGKKPLGPVRKAKRALAKSRQAA